MKEKIAALMSAAPSVEKEEEVKKRQAELRRAQDQLKKCLEDEDYMGAVAVKEKIAALMSATPSVEKEEEKRQAKLRRAQDQLKKCREEEDYKGAAAAQQNISTIMDAESCSHRVAGSGGTVAGQGHSPMETSKGVLTSIEKLAGCLPQACQPVCLEGVTLLSIGKVSDPEYSRSEERRVGKGCRSRWSPYH